MKYLIVLFLMMGACAKKSTDNQNFGPISCGIKPLFSEWTEKVKTNPFSLNLTGFKFGINEMHIFVGGEDYCKLDYEIQGTECSGTYKISNVQNVVGADVVDCKAEILEANGVYTKSSEGLRLDNKTTGESFAYEKMLN